jgi:hypothetical protein
MSNTSSNAAVDRRTVLRLATAGSLGFFSDLSLGQDRREPRLRRVWLRLLLEQVEQDVRAGKPLTDPERYLAGLTRVKNVYLDDQNGDLLLEGPGEDKWEVRADGSAIGAASGQPLLQLDDFAVAWRNANDGSAPPSVSLEHRQESIQRMREFIRGTPQPTTAAARADYTRRLQEVWGLQDAVTGGVPTNTRFNKVMVDADWEMKRVSLGLAETGVKDFPTYIDLEFKDLRRRVLAEGVNARKPDGGSRFWFFPAYTEFAHSEKLDAVTIPDDPVQLLTESHFRNMAEGRQVQQEPSTAAKDFADAFTKQYTAVAERAAIFGELRNLFDWVAIARLIRLIDAPRRIGWDMDYLRRGYAVGQLNVPGTMPGQVALRHAEVKIAAGLASLVFPARGGVSINVTPRLTGERTDKLRIQREAALLRRPRRGFFV